MEKNFCQSCGMPMSKPEDFGSNEYGSKNEDYCSHCFNGGAFRRPKESLYEVIESCIPHVVEAGICPDENSARKMLQMFLPSLKRWKKTNL
ncbi:MAG: zinc ribbon domain-containing protein [Defluviitaleaceae bacterium]|nr:zinc ribbon domain-containing protein [Defluviitaleaceae bacterium]